MYCFVVLLTKCDIALAYGWKRMILLLHGSGFQGILMKWDKKIIFMLTLEIYMDTTLPFTFTKLPITDLARVTSNFFLRTKFV